MSAQTLKPGWPKTVRVVEESPLAPERILAAAHDFSERRTQVFPAVQLKHFKVHDLGETTADVTEATRFGPFFNSERCDYDWSQPGLVTAIVKDTNIYGPQSSWELRATPNGTGSTVEALWIRSFKRGPKGRFFGTVYRLAGQRLFGDYLRDMLENLEKLEADGAPS